MLRCRGERRQGEVLVTVDGGSGPAQLALAVLLEVTDEVTAERFYQTCSRRIEADR